MDFGDLYIILMFRNPQNSIANYLGPYIVLARLVMCRGLLCRMETLGFGFDNINQKELRQQSQYHAAAPTTAATATATAITRPTTTTATNNDGTIRRTTKNQRKA